MTQLRLVWDRDRFERERPATRGDCEVADRPCPWFSCRYNLSLDINRHGSLILNAPAGEGGEHKWPRPSVIRQGDEFTADHADAVAEIALEHADACGTNCALDVADWGGASLSEIASFLAFAHKMSVKKTEDKSLATLRAERGAELAAMAGELPAVAAALAVASDPEGE